MTKWPKEGTRGAAEETDREALQKKNKKQQDIENNSWLTGSLGIITEIERDKANIKVV